MTTPLMNNRQQFGWMAIVLHWLVALAVFGLFGLGLYMVDLTYYDSWYRSAPHIHKSIGILLLGVMAFRVLWRLITPPPASLPGHQAWEKVSARLAHGILYILIFVVMVSGYLIPTVDGSGIDVFNWFTVPSITGPRKELEEIVGKVHYWSAWSLVVLAGVHALGAIKHHVIDRDETLRRIFGLSGR